MLSKQTAWRAVIFAMLGLLMEVLFVATASLARGSVALRGATSLWMAPVYAIAAFALAPASSFLKERGVPLPVRAAVYMLAIYSAELICGILFDAMGLKVWDYSAKPFNFRGYITAMYAPFWYLLGMVLEGVDARVRCVARALSETRDTLTQGSERIIETGR